MNQKTFDKIMAILQRTFSLHEADKLMDMTLDNNCNVEDVNVMMSRIALISEYEEGPLPGVCPQCGHNLYLEQDLDIDCIYVCKHCNKRI